SAFGDGRVYVEREIRPARHVEVQLLGDAAGTIIAIGERDCSLQRRHQKLVEESPAPGLTVEERRLHHELAVRIGRAAHLTNAATAEFLIDEDQRPWFLEVNTRLQVEHGVTELTGGFDLVVEQFWIAAGKPLSSAAMAAAGAAANPGRHAIEVRLSAEDPARQFAAAPGRAPRRRRFDGVCRTPARLSLAACRTGGIPGRMAGVRPRPGAVRVREGEDATTVDPTDLPGGVDDVPVVIGAVSRTDGGAARVEVVAGGWRFELEVEPARRAALRERATRVASAVGSGGALEVHAMIPG